MLRDGVKLFTQVYAPQDTSRRYPLLIVRTPFGIPPYGEPVPEAAWAIRVI